MKLKQNIILYYIIVYVHLSDSIIVIVSHKTRVRGGVQSKAEGIVESALVGSPILSPFPPFSPWPSYDYQLVGLSCNYD